MSHQQQNITDILHHLLSPARKTEPINGNMDPDIPLPSIENVQNARTASSMPKTLSPDSGNTPFHSMSPEKTPFRTPTSQPTSPAPLKIPKSGSKATTPIRDRQTTPVLQTRRSNSNLAAARNLTPSRPLFRRASSNLNPTSPAATSLPPITADSSPPVSWTASTVAQDYFARELEYHKTTDNKVVVFVHDSCYGHRFSRPKTSKAALSTIVERPERLLATLLGASAAYVRLGGRHASGPCGPRPDRDPSTGTKPPFVIRKTSRFVDLNHPAVTSVHGAKWMEELQIMCDSAEAKLAMNGKELVRPIGYGKDEAGNSLPKLHEGDLYLCSESLLALQGCLGGVCDAVDAVFSSANPTTRAFVNIRPPGHHCSADYPSGFCWLNNVHVGISYAAMTHDLTHAAIIDFDLHHGDGSQTITWDHNSKAQNLPKNAASHRKTPIGYYSLHDINSYPCEWGDDDKVRNASLCLQNAHGQSIWNVHLESWSSLSDFWQLYESKYKILLAKTRDFLRHHSGIIQRTGLRPKAAIFLSAGFDASQWESAGMQRHNVNVPTDFYARFTRDITKMSEEDGLGVDGRVISVLEGGYSDRALTSGVLSHLCGLTADANKVTPSTVNDTGLPASPDNSYSALWWSESQLEDLEALVAGRTPAPAKKTIKSSGNYSSPTQASTSRMTDNARERQSLSAQVEARLSLVDFVPDPPPEVDWVTASYELSRVLIPKDRQTLSCRHDELNAEATKARRERQSLLNLPSAPEEKMQLRGRKAKPPAKADGSNRPDSRSFNRRTTIAAVSELPDPTIVDTAETNRPRRRSSAASSILSTFQDMRISGHKPESTGVGRILESSADGGGERQEKADPNQAQPGSMFRVTRSRSRERSVEDSIANIKSNLAKDRLVLAKTNSEGTNTRSSSLSRPSSMTSSHVTKDGMDELTSGMKKVSIKLKMPTQEQHEANQKKAAEDAAQKTKPIRKPPVPRALKTKPATAPKAPRAPTKPRRAAQPTTVKNTAPAVPASGSAITSQTHPTAITGTMTVDRKEAAVAAKGQNNTRPPISSQEQPTDHVLDTAYTAGGGQSATGPQRELQTAATSIDAANVTESAPSVTPNPAHPAILPLQTATPRKTKSNLPVFTSTTPIPFSRTAHAVGKENSSLPKQDSVWDIPDTPHQ